MADWQVDTQYIVKSKQKITQQVSVVFLHQTGWEIAMSGHDLRHSPSFQFQSMLK